ncbi:hypothetical protein AGMMS49525_11760 [Bacteroidia bacterium]|nr:hypothetical protein AGMMS49525_11760 [Bacteroidia bacterium]
MYTETILRGEGMRILINHLGCVEAERFIALINREPFDYTEWQQNLFANVSVKELSSMAMRDYDKDTATHAFSVRSGVSTP